MPSEGPSSERTTPHTRMPDSTLALLMEGNRFISNRCDRLGSDLFETRLNLQKTICMRGEAAAELFYDGPRFRREGAAPDMLKKTLTGEDAIQGLDGDEHRQRKQLFMSFMPGDSRERLTAIARDEWRKAIRGWEGLDSISLYQESKLVLFRAVATWAGVPYQEREVEQRATDLGELFEGPGTIGPRHWKARLARRRAEKWASGLVSDVRAGRSPAEPGTLMHTFANFEGPGGDLLEPRVAGIELLNILRPTVAISIYIAFSGVALVSYPQCREQMRSGELEIECFIQEVRRYFPFFPFIAAKVRQDFTWNGFTFPADTRVVLDIYGTNRHRATWDEPGQFRPERFRDFEPRPYAFIPQGGGDHLEHHRCAGEWITIDQMQLAVDVLLNEMTYSVPPQDLRVQLRKMPAIPNSGVILADIRVTPREDM